MTKDDILQRFAEILKDHGSLLSTEYDKLDIPSKPSRRALFTYFGSWQNAVHEASSLYNLSLEKPEKKSGGPEYHPKVLKLMQQVEDLSRQIQTPKLHLDGVDHTVGVISDTHLGSLYADMALLDFAYDVFESEKVATVFHVGDLLDGEKMYRGHDYELSVHGADGQVDYCANKYPKRAGITTYFIDGNHDRSFWKRSGVNTGSKIAIQRSDMVYLGYQEADLNIGEGECTATVRLFHAEDGANSYAISYRPQRYISELPSGTKPDILLIGHYHKSELLFYRGVTAIQAAATQKQTPFMRGKRISAAVGFWILNITVGPHRVVKVGAQFYPVRS